MYRFFKSLLKPIDLFLGKIKKLDNNLPLYAYIYFFFNIIVVYFIKYGYKIKLLCYLKQFTARFALSFQFVLAIEL